MHQQQSALFYLDGERRSLLYRAKQILDENPDQLTVEQKREIEALRRTAKSLENVAEAVHRGPTVPFPLPGEKPGIDERDSLKAEYRDGTGRPVYRLRPEQRMTSIPSDRDTRYDGVRFGDVVAAWLAPGRRDVQHARRALSESVNAAGAVMVADELSNNVIDVMRANSVLIQAGAQTIPMASDVLTVARVASDPSFTVVAENAAIGESDPTFDAVNLVAKKIGAIIRVSRELIEDGPNVADLIEGVMAKALAVEIDRQALLGTGAAELEGLHLRAGLTEASIGAVTDYTEMISAITKMMNANQMPNSWILNPTMGMHYEGLKEAANGQYLVPPPTVAGLKRLITSSLPATGYTAASESPMFLLDGTQVMIGVRRAIEIGRSDQRYWAEDQIGFKATVRLDLALMRSNACVYMSGAKIS